MDEFLKELPALIITVSVLIMATVLVLIGHVGLGDILTLVSPVIAFWFIGKAFQWQAPPTQPTNTLPLQGVSQEKAL